jgi:hypothetical protein
VEGIAIGEHMNNRNWHFVVMAGLVGSRFFTWRVFEYMFECVCVCLFRWFVSLKVHCVLFREKS